MPNLSLFARVTPTNHQRNLGFICNKNLTDNFLNFSSQNSADNWSSWPYTNFPSKLKVGSVKVLNHIIIELKNYKSKAPPKPKNPPSNEKHLLAINWLFKVTFTPILIIFRVLRFAPSPFSSNLRINFIITIYNT